MAKVTQKTILVTGATSGIGRAITLSLARDNTTIIAIGRNKIRLQSLQRDISNQGGICHTYSIDFRKQVSVKRLYRNIKKRFKKIHWIIYSAGTIGTDESMDHIKESTVKNIFAVNIFSILSMTSLFLSLVKRGGFIHISSTAGIWGNGRKPIYSASKGALNAFGKSLAWYLSDKKDLSSIVICPGPTNTPMRQKTAGDADKHQSPVVIADVVKYIIDGKSKYKNGDVLIINKNKISVESRLTD